MKFYLLVYVSLIVTPSSLLAEGFTNAKCDVRLNGSDFIVGRCSVQTEDPGTIELGSAKTDPVSGFSTSRLKTFLSEEANDVEYVGYNTSDMSRFADISLEGITGDITEAGGCLQSPAFKACFALDGAASGDVSAEDIFSAASNGTRQAAQQKLQEYGYYQGAIDGEWGPGTEQGLIAFDEISHIFSLIDEAMYRFSYDERGMRAFLADVEKNRVEPLISVYSFCDNVDGHMLDVSDRQGDQMREVVWQAYRPVSEKWCPVLFVEGE